MNRFYLIVCLLSFVSVKAAFSGDLAREFAEDIRPQLVKYCGDCHSDTTEENPALFLATTSWAEVAEMRGLWSSAAEQLHNRTMPPPDEPQPTETERLKLAQWIKVALQKTACDCGESAPPVVTRRLNRFEYENTVYDLLGVHLHADETFPVDGSGGEGFNNNGETLFLSPLLLERYLAAATTALNASIITPPLHQTINSERFAVRDTKTRRDTSALVNVYTSGRYDLSLKYESSAKKETSISIRIDGITLDRFKTVVSDKMQVRKVELHLDRGAHVITFRGTSDVNVNEIQLHEKQPSISPQKRENHRKLFLNLTAPKNSDARSDARRVISTFMSRAFRRPVESEEVASFVELYDRGAKRGDSYEEAVKTCAQGSFGFATFSISNRG